MAHRNFGLMLIFVSWICSTAALAQISEAEFAERARRVLPVEEPYSYHEYLNEGPIHLNRRDPSVSPTADQFLLPERGWSLVSTAGAGLVLEEAVEDFRDYLTTSMEVEVSFDRRRDLQSWESLTRAIIAAEKADLPGCGAALRGPGSYQIIANPDRIVVCGFDEISTMHGLYNLEARMNLVEAPILPASLNLVRHSHHQTRMVLNWMGWMEWSDRYLRRLAHDGFDAIYASAYSNPNGAEGTAHYVMVRRQDPERMQDLVKRAARFGIKVYTPILYRYTGTSESEQGLREHVRDILHRFPDIKGYVLLTEGFIYDSWFGAGGHGSNDLKEWAANWTKAVEIVVEECRKVNPSIEVLPWEYNIDFRPQQVELKRYVLSLLPEESIPLLTFENGKSFDIDGFRGFVRDYSINVIGPAEVTEGQMEEARDRGMKVYSKADTFASWQFGTLPYLPVPYQWHKRYQALVDYQVDGTLESWSFGYNPSFVTELRAWYSWTDAPPLEELLTAMARNLFGSGQEELVLESWKEFSRAIQSVVDTGPSMGTNFALGNPMFFEKPPARTMTIQHSWWDQQIWMTHLASRINPYWPYTRNAFTFMPDFTNQTNMAESYALSRSGVIRVEDPEKLKGVNFLPIFLGHLRKAADSLESGLRSYREAAFGAPPAKQKNALKEVQIVEQMQRTLRSSIAILEFEDARFRLHQDVSRAEKLALLDRMERLLKDEIVRTRLALEAAQRDSRLGFEMEVDYMYTWDTLTEKLEVLKDTLARQIPDYREREGLR